MFGKNSGVEFLSQDASILLVSCAGGNVSMETLAGSFQRCVSAEVCIEWGYMCVVDTV